MIASSTLLDQLENPYSTPPDFFQLAQDVTSFAPFLIKTGNGYTIDWKDQESVRALTRALLERDFNLKLSLPKDRLCPTVPSRLEYCLWVLKLSLLTSPESPSENPHTGMTSNQLIGLDIGTGASAIYPLLISRLLENLKLEPNSSILAYDLDQDGTGTMKFKILASELDQESLECATGNVRRNGLEGKVDIIQADGPEELEESDSEEEEEEQDEEDQDDDDEEEWELISETILCRALQEDEVIDFIMLNPPFYSSRTEMFKSAQRKELEPFAVCTASENELICKGGEVKFVKKLIKESLDVGCSRVRWFTSLIGKYSSIEPLINQLRSYRISNYHLHLLSNSGQTRRWILTWSLTNDRIPSSILPPIDPTIKKYLPQFQGVQSFSLTLPSSSSTSNDPPTYLRNLVEKSLFSNLGDAVSYQITSSSSNSNSIQIYLSAKSASWTRSARRGGGNGTKKPPPPKDSRGERPVGGGGGVSLCGRRPQLDLGGGGMNGLIGMGFMHNLSQDESVESERDEANLLEAEFKLRVVEGRVELEGEWRKGYDSRMSGNAWESLWGTLRRKLKEGVGEGMGK
ncbi:hypothetical protein JCM5353_000371 [Sporobolomyces roseus]